MNTMPDHRSEPRLSDYLPPIYVAPFTMNTMQDYWGEPTLSDYLAQRNTAPFTTNTLPDYRSLEGAIDGLTHAQEPVIDEDASSAQIKDEQESEHERTTFDTGIQAWLQVLGAFFLWFNTWGLINAYGAFQTYYEQNTLSDISPSTISWIGSVQSALPMVFSVVAGPLFDAGYFAMMLPLGTFLLVFGMMLTSFATNYSQIMLAQGVCVGLGTGFLFLPAVALLPQYFKRKRSLANGLAASGSSIGGVLYPIMFHKLQHEIGFPWATRVLACVALATCCFSIAVMRLRFRPQQKQALFQLSTFTDPRYMLFCLAIFFGYLGFYNFLVYIQPYAIQTGAVDDNISFYLLAILNATSTFGRVIPNYIADYTGPLNMLIPSLAATSMLAYCWAAVRSMSGIIALSSLYGFTSGGFLSLAPVAIISIIPDDHNVGARLGGSFAVESIGLLLGTPIGGAILRNSGSYLGVQMFCGSCLALCTVLMTVIRFSQSGMRLRYKS